MDYDKLLNKGTDFRCSSPKQTKVFTNSALFLQFVLVAAQNKHKLKVTQPYPCSFAMTALFENFLLCQSTFAHKSLYSTDRVNISEIKNRTR